MSELKTSRFNVSFRNESGEMVLANLLTKAIAEVERKNEQIVKKFLKNPNAPCSGKDEKEILDNLKYGGYVIDSAFDEIAHLKLVNSMERFDRSQLAVTIMPTMQCNFNCVYCYEKKEGPVMDLTVADTIVSFAKEMLKDKKRISLGWFGGEPLLAFHIIEYINSRVADASQKEGLKFDSFITTNGYLLDDKKIEMLEPLSIRSLQITLDGPPRFHNKYRPLKGGGPTFDRIYSNLARLFEKTKNVSVKLRVNIGPDNYDSVDELLDMLERFPKDRFLVYFRWIFQGSDLNPEFHRRVNAFMGTPKEKFLKLADLYYKAVDRGFEVMLPILNSNVYCEYDRVSSILIGPKGGLYLCTVAVGEKFVAGRITPDGPVYDSKLYERWHGFSAFEDEQCLKCPLLPLCFGGCRNARMNGMSRGCPEELGYIEEFAKLWYRVEKKRREGAEK